MKIVIAPDSFKGTATAIEVADCIAEGIQSVLPAAQIVRLPIADGGEGTVDAFVHAAGGSLHTQTVCGPLGKPVQANWCVLSDGTAVIEMAQASGLTLVPAEALDPLAATTRGTGEVMRAALDAGCSKMIIGIGGSATNDGGAGMAEALGVRFLDAAGQPLPPGGAALQSLATIDASGLDKRIAHTHITIACDVTNPLCGPNGASAVYGPQKGATPQMVQQLDAALAHYADVIAAQLGQHVRDIPGAGAAGGLGAGLLAFCRAVLSSGIETILNATAFDELLADTDLVVTGEGRIDAQSVNGKVPVGVAQRTKAVGNIPVIAVVGGIGKGGELALQKGIDHILPLARTDDEVAYAKAHTKELLVSAGMQVASQWTQ